MMHDGYLLITYALAKWLYPCAHIVPTAIFCLKSLLVAGKLTYSFDIFTEQPLDYIGHLLLTISAKKKLEGGLFGQIWRDPKEHLIL